MRHTTSQLLFGYWNDVRAGRPAPRRFDIEPSQISHILSETLILERVDFETYRFRLAGTKVCEQFGFELRGVDLLALWDQAEDRLNLEQHLATITRQSKVGVTTFTAETRRGATAQFEMILLPLIHTQNRVDRCLGAISMAWPNADDSRDRTFRNHRLSTVTTFTPEPVATHDLGVNGGAEPLPLKPAVRAARIVRHNRRQFRVYDGGRSTSE